MLLPSRKASKELGLHPNTLRKYADEGKIRTIRNEGGQRLYDVSAYLSSSENSETILYCRVSSQKQKDDLQRQVEDLKAKFPKSRVVTDIGSGINFRRKGLQSILEQLLQGSKLTIVVAHKDRLARFGFDLIEFMVRKNGGEIVVLDDSRASPQAELTADLLNILHVFSCRMHGLRRYKSQIKEDPILSEGCEDFQEVDRSF